jgi:hypothetical protein
MLNDYWACIARTESLVCKKMPQPDKDCDAVIHNFPAGFQRLDGKGFIISH